MLSLGDITNPKHNVNPRWAGQTVVCIASGPSLTPEDVEYIRGKSKVIAVNANFLLAPWADVLYGADFRFWHVYMPDIKQMEIKSEMWSLSAQAKKVYGINVIAQGRGDGYSIVPNSINTGGNSGYQALHLAAYWSAKRVILLGYDMQRTGGKEHWHGKHKGNLPNGRGFPLWIRRFNILARDLKRRGVEVLNCSRETALRCVPRVPLEKIAW